MKTILAVLMIPSALFATWATKFVQAAAAEADARPATAEPRGQRVKAVLGEKIETLRGSFEMDTRQTLSVGAALRKGQSTIDRAMGRPAKVREDYEREREELAREIERERAEIRSMRAEDAALKAARLRAGEQKEAAEPEDMETP